MNYRPFGKTGLRISAITLGTVSLGVDYGIEAPGEFGCPGEAEAIRLLQHAADAGINLFDTAPAYGESERLLGLALGKRDDCLIATKVSVTQDDSNHIPTAKVLKKAIDESINNSLRALKRDVLDIVQIHNPTVDLVKRGEVLEVLLEEKKQGKIRFLGASVYTEAEAMAIIEAGSFDLLQVAYNILDQRMAQQVFPAARNTGVAIFNRSALLKGALTEKAKWLPVELTELKEASEKAMNALSGTWQSLPEAAVRFCLSNPFVASILIGVRTEEELIEGLKATEVGPLPDELLSKAQSLALSNEYLLNPSHWPVVL